MNKKPISRYSQQGIPPFAYLIAEDGGVFSTESEDWLKPQPDKDGYQSVDLKSNGNRVRIKLHREVAMTFLPPPQPGQTEVNHIDGNRQNNTLSNLEWVSHAENIQHRNNVLKSNPGGKRAKPTILLDTKSGEVMICLSHIDAIGYLNISAPTFYNAVSTGAKIRDIMVLTKILNPEVIQDERYQDRGQHGAHRADPAGQGSASGQGRGSGGEPGTDETGEAGQESPGYAAHQRAYDKWSKRVGIKFRPAQESADQTREEVSVGAGEQA